MARSVSWFRSWWSLLFVLGLVGAGALGCFGEGTRESYTPPAEHTAVRSAARAPSPRAMARPPSVRSTARARSPGQVQAELRARAALR